MRELNLISKDGRCYIDSREVAVFLGRKHERLLRDINGCLKLVGVFTESGYSNPEYFVYSEYKDEKDETRSFCLISKLGAEAIANKLFGKKAVLFTAAYVTAFNETDKEIRKERFAELADSCIKAQHVAGRILSAVFEAAFVPDKQKDEILQGIYEQLGIQIPIEPSNVRMAYHVSDITKQLGVLSLNGKPHTLAVTAIISMLPIADEHKIVVPYNNSTFIGYDDYVINSIKDWLICNKFPCEIECGDKIYKVQYKHREMG